jgi:SAM-dependent methyltransferase
MFWRKRSESPRPAAWPLALPCDMTAEQVARVRHRVEELSERAQYGWGHTIRFGPFTKEGVMKDNFLHIAGHWDAWGWWPQDMQGLRVADIGCLTGGLTMLVAHRGAEEVLAVDQIPEHLDQCSYLSEVFGLKNVRTLTASLYDLPQMDVGKFDVVILSGVLYHLSDMLVGILVMRELLKVGGTLLMETAAVGDDEHSYADFGRFAIGMWWRPSTLCVKDMCEFMGMSEVEVKMYWPDRCFARARKSSDEQIRFRRGLNYPFGELKDAVARNMDLGGMAPK